MKILPISNLASFYETNVNLQISERNYKTFEISYRKLALEKKIPKFLTEEATKKKGTIYIVA